MTPYPQAPLIYFVLDARDDWMRIRTEPYGSEGWILAGVAQDDWSLQDRLPELDFIDALIGYLQVRVSESSRASAWSRTGLTRFTERSTRRVGEVSVAMAEVLQGHLDLIDWNRTRFPALAQTAQRHYEAAAALVPYSTETRTLAAIAAIPACCDDATAGKRVREALEETLVSDPQSDRALSNLEKLYALGGTQLGISAAQVSSRRLTLAMLPTDASPTGPQDNEIRFASRNYLFVAGSAAVSPFNTAVIQRMGASLAYKPPQAKIIGAGRGIESFCGGVGAQYPDVITTSQRLSAAEVEDCTAHDIKDLFEIKLGYDSIVLANSRRGPRFRLTRADLFRALAKNVPEASNPATLIPNPYRTWRDVNRKLPAVEINVLGPAPHTAAHAAFLELVMEAGCGSYVWIKSLSDTDKKRFNEICHGLRDDGRYVETGEQDAETVQTLASNPKVLGIVSFKVLEENLDRLQSSVIDGVAPTSKTIASTRYPASRPLFLYAKMVQVAIVPGAAEFMIEYTSRDALGANGYLVAEGLVPPPDRELAKARASVEALEMPQP